MGADCFESHIIFFFTELFFLQIETTDTLVKKEENLEIILKTLIMIVLEMKQS